jgi:hypothetical protein
MSEMFETPGQSAAGSVVAVPGPVRGNEVEVHARLRDSMFYI